MNRIPNSFSGSMYLKMGNSSKRTNYAIFAILGSELMKIETPYIIVHEKGDFKLKLMDLPIEGELNKNLIVGVIENPFTLDKDELVQQKVEFVNLISLVEK